MKLKRCPNSHYYDEDQYPACPTCNPQLSGVPTPPPVPMPAPAPVAAPAPAVTADPPQDEIWNCTCGSVNKGGNFCANCGSKRPAPQPAPAPEPQAEDKSWICTNCGGHNEGNFCFRCGSKRPEPAAAAAPVIAPVSIPEPEPIPAPIINEPPIPAPAPAPEPAPVVEEAVPEAAPVEEAAPEAAPVVEEEAATESSTWVCACGATNDDMFCYRCGSKKPENEPEVTEAAEEAAPVEEAPEEAPAPVEEAPKEETAPVEEAAPESSTWVCACGATNDDMFCYRCGSKRPENEPEVTEAAEEAAPVEEAPEKEAAPVEEAPKEETAPVEEAAPESSTWVCACGATNDDMFCYRCGSKRPENEPEVAEASEEAAPVDEAPEEKAAPVEEAPKEETAPVEEAAPESSTWVCACGATNDDMFCYRCGSKRPENEPEVAEAAEEAAPVEEAPEEEAVPEAAPVEEVTEEPAPVEEAAPESSTWVCACGATNDDMFCYRCGSKRPENEPEVAEAAEEPAPVEEAPEEEAAAPVEEEAAPEAAPVVEETAAPESSTWVCACGATNDDMFCYRCGSKRPENEPEIAEAAEEPAPVEEAPEEEAAAPVEEEAAPESSTWVCACGATNDDMFCYRCGSKKPENEPEVAEAAEEAASVEEAPEEAPAPVEEAPKEETAPVEEVTEEPAPVEETAAPESSSWTCACGMVNDDNFCFNCGAPRPVAAAVPVPAPAPVSETAAEAEEKSLDEAISDAGFTGSLEAAKEEIAAEDDDEGATLIIFDELADEMTLGWLVAANTDFKGRIFTVKDTKSTIGRGDAEHAVVIDLRTDRTISRGSQAVLIYDPMNKKFFIQSTGGKTQVYVNRQMVIDPVELAAYDRIIIGSTELVFVPLCCDKFSW